LAAARRGDQEAFLLLFKRHRTGVFRFLYRFLGSEEAAEHITHDCYLELVRNPEDARFSKDSLLTQLYARARNLAMEHLPHLEEKKREHAATEHQQVNPREQLQRAAVDGDSVEQMKQAISALPPLERETLILFEYEAFPVNEIATIVGADDEVVRTRLNDARQKLRRALSH
jgi:RNA polymerase sigma-70 factor (ECF subfamily)